MDNNGQVDILRDFDTSRTTYRDIMNVGVPQTTLPKMLSMVVAATMLVAYYLLYLIVGSTKKPYCFIFSTFARSFNRLEDRGPVTSQLSISDAPLLYVTDGPQIHSCTFHEREKGYIPVDCRAFAM